MQIPKTLLEHFRLNGRPEYTDPVLDAARDELAHAAEEQHLFALCGDIGVGKTHLVRQAKALAIKRAAERGKTPPAFVRVADMSDGAVRMSSIHHAIVYDLAEGVSPRRSREARSRQIEQLLGQRIQDERGNVVLVIEDAHRLHRETLRALKRLREADFAGVAPLCGIWLVGWSDLDENIERLPDIKLRTTTLRMTQAEGFYTLERRMAYLTSVFGNALSPEARVQLAADHATPAHMNAAVLEAMREAYEVGYTQVDLRIIDADLSTLKDAAGVSVRKAGQAAGLSKSVAGRVLKGEGTPEQQALMQEALQGILAGSEEQRPALSLVG